MDSKISGYSELAEAPAATDEFVIVDKSDTTMAATGTTKRIKAQYVKPSEITAASSAGPTKFDFFEDTDNGTNKVTVQAPASVSSDAILTLPSGTGSIVSDASIHAAASKSTPVDADEIPIVDSAASYVLKNLTWANVKATLLTYFDTIYPQKNGWVSYSTVTPTRASADDPTYVLTFAGVNLTSTMSVGMRVKMTQNSATIYGIITAISFSTNTTMTLYCGTDYDVLDTATYAISAFNYSTQKAPFGFPLDPTKWTVTVTDSSDRTQSSPTASTWYNLGSVSITIPIGVWDTKLKVVGYTIKTSATSVDNFVTLSTANNSESNSKMTSYCIHGGATGAISPSQTHVVEDTLVLASKTTYYLNTKTSTASASSIYNGNGFGTPAIIRAVCAYL